MFPQVAQNMNILVIHKMQEIIQRTLIYSLSILVVKIISLISCPKEMTVLVS